MLLSTFWYTTPKQHMHPVNFKPSDDMKSQSFLTTIKSMLNRPSSQSPTKINHSCRCFTDASQRTQPSHFPDQIHTQSIQSAIPPSITPPTIGYPVISKARILAFISR